MVRRLYRIPERGMIAGVAAGFADYFDTDVTLMRLIFVAAALLSAGAAVIAYLVCAFVLPVKGVKGTKDFDIEARAEALASEMKQSGRMQNMGNYMGLALIVLGAWLLLGQFFPWLFEIQWNIIWPSLIILLGVWIISKGRR